ncbi:MAG TPA: hypothetical protein VEQ37_12460 [Actinomycetota bacterium]|nr:hypothetical protein [Actinomycetota bacterium]
MTRIGLVGCVKSKLPHPAPAADLYTSPPFRGARRAVEWSCDRWFILSAEHGLVDPGQVLDPYERTLATAPTAERRRWAQGVLAQIDEHLGDVGGIDFEVHAGTAYLEYGLKAGLAARGAHVVDPLQGLPLGRRLAYYKALD